MKKPARSRPSVYDRVQFILASAQDYTARSVNTAQVVANWLIGREIIEEQQQGSKRAGYGVQITSSLAERLNGNGVRGYGELSLRHCRQFYQTFPILPGEEICYALRNESAGSKTLADPRCELDCDPPTSRARPRPPDPPRSGVAAPV